MQLAAELPEYWPAGHSVHVAGLPPLKGAGIGKPPLTEYEPAAHAPEHVADCRPVTPVM